MRPQIHLSLGISLCFILGTPHADEVRGSPLRIGILGDSLSAGDGSANGEAPNWHTQLEANGLITIGSTANQAVGMATANTLAGQLTEIVSLIQTSQLDATVLMIGGNDAANFGL